MLTKNKECFLIGDKKIEQSFAQSLLDFLDLNIWSFCAQFDEMRKAVQELRSGNDKEKNIALVRRHLDTVSKTHVYLEHLKTEWNKRLDNHIKSQDLPVKQLSHIPSNIQTMQEQIKDLLKNVLDVMSPNEPVQKKLACYYDKSNEPLTDSLRFFSFRELTTKFEKVDCETFTEVLYPTDIYDILEFILRACLKREQPFKICKSCGRYFAIYSHANTEYCNRMFKDTGKTCKEIGSVKVYQQKAEENPAIKLYNRAYKTHFARIKYRLMTKEEFQNWAEIARGFRDQCLAGELGLEEFGRWLKG